MAVLLIGAGNAGSALLDNVCERGAGKNPRIAIGPKVPFKHIKNKEQYRLTDKGFFGSGDEVVGRSDFKDTAASASAMNSYDAVLLEMLNKKIEDVDAAIIFLGLGGITGSGIAPTIARTLSDLDVPAMVFGMLPAPAGAETHARYGNVRYAIESLKKYTDAFLLVDNQRIAYTDNIESMYLPYNQYAAVVISDILSGSDPKTTAATSIRVRDMILNMSLSGGGFTVFGRASIISKDLLHYFIPIGGHKTVDVPTMIGVAIEKMSMNADTKIAQKSTVLFRVPSWYMKEANAIDTRSIERFQEENSSEGHYLGISLTKRSLVTLTIFFTYRYGDLPRLCEIRDDAL